MSGPKVDIAEVRHQEMMKLAAARDERRKLFDKVRNLIKQVSDAVGDGKDIESLNDSEKQKVNEIKGVQKDCLNELNKILVAIKMGNEMLNIQQINARIDEAITTFKSKTNVGMQSHKSMLVSGQQAKAVEANRQMLQNVRKKRMVVLMSESEDNDAEVSQETVDEIVKAFDEELSGYIKDNVLTGKQKNSLLLINQDYKEIADGDLSLKRKERRLKTLFGEYQKLTGFIDRENSELKVLYSEYVSECFDLYIEPAEFGTFSDKKEIENAISNCKKMAESQLSKEYIKRQLDEVMAKHGYDVIKSDMLSEINESGQILYGVDSDTAIDVFVSDENQVTMRVVGIGFDSDLSDADDERLLQQQCAFCSMHPKITSELAMRGVILHTKKHMAPNKKFNKKIQTKNKTEGMSTSRAKKELKRTGLKTMHRE